jgi:hypothetical protein
LNHQNLSILKRVKPRLFINALAKTNRTDGAVQAGEPMTVKGEGVLVSRKALFRASSNLHPFKNTQ